ncbi:hypothetical protein CAEBREN_32403 [Caenorhabditis brenneri]|uniref:Tyrosine-protein phosphatase domain-containing protein n=1 Tax=Caenorhabditis brenneri TaxID=135651 RepID=G0MZV2_CAEBE|nr:hypothetical protein CAEBREN_32403 [Caenorhabditis brenneri]
MALQYSEIQSQPQSGQQGIEGAIGPVKRNAPTDQLELFVKHSSIISRIANGIALQTGLMEGSIPIDGAVGELLNFGSVSVSDVANFKGDNVSDLIGRLRILPKDIDSSAKSLEDVALAWNQLRIDSESAKDAINPPRKEDYFTALDTLSNSFDYKLLTTAYGEMEALFNRLNEIANKVASGEPDASRLDSIYQLTFSNLPGNIQNFLDSLKNLPDLSKTINQNDILVKSNEVFKPIQEAIRLFKNRGLIVKSTPGSLSIMETNFRKAFELASAAASSLPQTILLKSLTDSRVNSQAIQRKFTSAFSNGKHEIDELFADMHNKWIETVSRGNITQVMLTQSFSPLSFFKSKLTEIDKVFGSTLDKSSSESLVKMEEIQRKLSKFKEESVNSASVIEQLENCKLQGPPLFDPSESVIIIENAKNLGEWLTRFNKKVLTLDLEKLKNETEKFKESIGFTDWSDQKGSASQVPQALNNLRGNDILSKFKTMIDGIKTGISVNVTKLQEDITSIKNGQGTVNSFNGLKEELELHECLQQLKDQSELLAHAIDTTRNLKKLDASNSKGQNTFNIDDFENIVNVVTGVSEKIEDIKSIPERMIKEATSLTNETNRLPRNISEIVGSAVTSLRSAHELKKLATASIPQLKQIDNTIKNELKAVTDPTKKKSIEDSWGDHDQDIATLEDAIKQIEGVEGDMNLTDIKFINQYGKPFLQLKQLKDMNIDTKSKIQALEMLIPTSNSKGELEKSKATLSTIDSLDLQFSNHHTQFEEASMAFQNFYKFFVDITTSQKKKQSNLSSGNNGADKDKKNQDPNYALIGGVAGGGSVFIGGVIAAALFVYFKYWKHRVNKNAIKKWIRKQMFPDSFRKNEKGKEYNEKYADAYRCHEALLKAMEIYVGRMQRSFEYLPENKHRDLHGVNPETALHHLMKDGVKMPINANWVIAPDGKKFIATSSPIIKSKKKEDTREDTREDFWHMVMLENVEYIVMLCLENEGNFRYYPAEINKSETFGRYTVEWVMDGTLGDFTQIKYKKLKITTKGGKSSTVTHFNYIGWPDGQPPEEGDLKNVYELLKYVEQTKAPVVVHCLAGIGRTMTFIGVYTTAEEVKVNPKLLWGEALAKLREARWYAIQTIRQSYWLQVAVCDKLNRDLKLGMDEEIKSMHETFIHVAYDFDLPEEAKAAKAIKKKEMKKDPKRDKMLDFGRNIAY